MCVMVTDSVSFNVLCKGQLEYFKESLGLDITLVCGGNVVELQELRRRNIGRVVFIPFKRRPALCRDIYCLFLLFAFFCRNRFDMVLYSTPKAMLLGAISSAFSFQRNRVALVRGRAYENFVGVKRFVYSMLDKVSLFLSKRVIFISSSLKDAYISEKVVGSDKSLVLANGSSNGVDVNRFNPGHERHGPLRVVSVGRICIDKGVQQLNEIVRRVKCREPSVEFELVGKIEDELAFGIVRDLSKIDGVTYVANNSRVEDVFQRADVHLFLSHREGFGNVALEAAACGVPTLALDVVGVRDSVAQGVSGVRFDVNDFFDIADEIVWAAKNRTAFREKYSGARKWAVENYSQDVVWNAYAEFFKGLLDYGERL